MPTKQTILCPKCQKLAHWNSHFQKYSCTECTWTGQDTGESLKRVAKVFTLIEETRISLLGGNKQDMKLAAILQGMHEAGKDAFIAETTK